MAPSRKIYLAMLEKFQGFMRFNTTIRTNAIGEDEMPLDSVDDYVEGVEDADVHMGLIEFPSDAGAFELSMWFFLFPLRFIMHFTLPDVRHIDCHGDTTAGINKAFFATFMCLVWLVIGSYAMVTSLEDLAELLDIPDAVVGFTVSAAGKYRI
jgi:Ca2+/Na+ antiporter